MVKFSFYKMKYVGARKFVGLDNYRAIFKRDDIIGALKLCLYYMAGALIQLAIALYLATILSMKVKCSNLFKGFMFFPYLINGIAIGFIFKFFYTRGFVFDTVLQWCGFQLDNLPYWLKDQSVNNWSLVGLPYGDISDRTWYFSSVPSCLWMILFMRQQTWTEQTSSSSSATSSCQVSKPS